MNTVAAEERMLPQHLLIVLGGPALLVHSWGLPGLHNNTDNLRVLQPMLGILLGVP